jgi:glutamate dehydrogenase (NAD(P)+)
LFREKEDVMRRDYHILDRAFDQMLARARAAKAVYRTVEMVIGFEQADAGEIRRGLFR